MKTAHQFGCVHEIIHSVSPMSCMAGISIRADGQYMLITAAEAERLVFTLALAVAEHRESLTPNAPSGQGVAS